MIGATSGADTAYAFSAHKLSLFLSFSGDTLISNSIPFGIMLDSLSFIFDLPIILGAIVVVIIW